MGEGKPRARDGAWMDEPFPVLVPLDAAHASAELADMAARAGEAGLADLEKLLKGKSPAAAFIAAILDLSSFLRDSIRRTITMLEHLRTGSIDARLETLLSDIRASATADGVSETSLMEVLRRLKGEAHAIIALDDLAHGGNAPETVVRLSNLADAAIGAAIRFLLRDAHEAGKLVLPDPENPETGSGWIILGMGKLGAHELNFSSDIDLIVFFDPQAPAITDPYDASDLFVRLTRRLVRIL